MNMLFTCFSIPSPGTSLASQHQTVPNNRAPLQEGLATWVNYFKGKQTMRELLSNHGGSVCLVAPERLEHMPMIIGKVQRDLMELHLADILGIQEDTWRFGILVNAPRFPLLYKEKRKDFWLGMHMHHMDFFHVGLWPFIDDLQFFKPPKMMQVGVGWDFPKAAQVCRYFGLLVFSGKNQQAKACVTAAHSNEVWLPNSQNIWMERWGTLRMDLDFLEKKMNQNPKAGNNMLLKTWRWLMVKPPPSPSGALQCRRWTCPWVSSSAWTSSTSWSLPTNGSWRQPSRVLCRP